eukprot:4714674-Pyramimonas_sp.AAC.1
MPAAARPPITKRRSRQTDQHPPNHASHQGHGAHSAWFLPALIAGLDNRMRSLLDMLNRTTRSPAYKFSLTG